MHGGPELSELVWGEHSGGSGRSTSRVAHPGSCDEPLG